jgi:hypothetical protein
MRVNPNKKAVFLFFGLRWFMFGFPGGLSLDFANKLFFVWFSQTFCMDFPDFYLDFAQFQVPSRFLGIVLLVPSRVLELNVVPSRVSVFIRHSEIQYTL